VEVFNPCLKLEICLQVCEYALKLIVFEVYVAQDIHTFEKFLHHKN